MLLASPNKHLHPQIDTELKKKEKSSKPPFWKGHRRSTSHHQFTQDSREKAEATQHHSLLKEVCSLVILDSICEFLSQEKSGKKEDNYNFLDKYYFLQRPPFF